MKKTIKYGFLISICMLIVACNNDGNVDMINSQEINLDGLNYVEEQSNIDVKLFDENNKEVTSEEDITLGKSYNLKIKAVKPIIFKVVSQYGSEFDKESIENMSFSENFEIKVEFTQPEFNQLFFAMVPIFLEDGEMIKERPHSFLLPKPKK